MLKILGSRKPFHAGLDRREVMRIGGLGAIGLSLPDLLRLEAAASVEKKKADGVFGRVKRIMLVYLQGAATQFETWDPKPEASQGIRGKWGAIDTVVPGISIGEKLPKLAKVTDRMAIVRSMTHAHNNHSNLYTLTGYPAVDFPSETNPFDSRHHPFFGSVLDYLEDQRVPNEARDVPRDMALPFRFSTFSPVFRRAGPYGAFLGSAYNPVWTEFEGRATKKVPRVSFFRRGKSVDIEDPFLGVTPESRLKVSKAAQLRPDMTVDRLDRRRSLLEQLEDESRRIDRTAPSESVDRFREMAYSLITSSKLHTALDLDREPMSLREQYGMTLFGQSALTGRRLLEAGARLVSVFWDEYKVVNTAWDTHFNHFSRLENELLPGFDAGLSTLLLDLDERGLLDETLVMCLTEHGRTSQITGKQRGGGRGHWSRAYSVMLAGAGIRPGTIVGASDARGAWVRKRPTSPSDILATMFHLQGIDLETTIPNRLGEPVRIVDDGRVVPELLA